jgi:hypothetical protein
MVLASTIVNCRLEIPTYSAVEVFTNFQWLGNFCNIDNGPNAPTNSTGMFVLSANCTGNIETSGSRIKYAYEWKTMTSLFIMNIGEFILITREYWSIDLIYC